MKVGWEVQLRPMTDDEAEELLENYGCAGQFKITRSLNDREIIAHGTSRAAIIAAHHLVGGQAWRRFTGLGTWVPFTVEKRIA